MLKHFEFTQQFVIRLNTFSILTLAGSYLVNGAFK